ncbi:MAG: NAD(P)H-dependent oxidoreductase [Archangium sp.]|nr:NAD(P)H-dependent oxidoreductase [Archangium sp.]
MTLMTLLTAHPVEDSFNTSLAAAWKQGAERAGATVRHFDVNTLRFDPVLRHAYRGEMADEPDLAEVRASVAASSHVTFVFPTWWVGLPAVMKGLVDRLLLPGWAFKFEGKALPTGLMAGKSARYLTTMDSPSLWYRLAHHDSLAGSFGRGTLAFCGFAPIRRTLVFDTRKLGATQRTRWLEKVEAEGALDARRGEKTALKMLPNRQVS